MKKYVAPLALLVLSVALLLASVPTKDVGAQGRPDDPGSQSARRADGKIVAPDGVVFESHQAFIDAGRRCSTRHVDDIEIEEIDNDIKSNRSGSGRAGSGGGSGGSGSEAARVYLPGTVIIPVHFHVVYRSDG